MMDKISFVITCEHASNEVPQKYRSLFLREDLETHIGYDIGAKEYAVALAKKISAKLFLGAYTRLFIDLNRSEKNPALFSKMTKCFQPEEKKELLEKYYRPFRKSVVEYIANEISCGKVVVHLSCHTFTPELNGKKRNFDVGILYDPARAKERILAKKWKEVLEKNSSMVVRLNAPYRGKSDGHTTALRLRFSQEEYIGIEIEVNQRLFTSCVEKNWVSSFIASNTELLCH